jgi:hypothetical protein
MQKRTHKMNRESRLKAAKDCTKTYPVKKIVHGYKKYFGVDIYTAAIELRMLGFDISQDYITTLRINKNIHTGKKKIKEESFDPIEWFDDSDLSDPVYLVLQYEFSKDKYEDNQSLNLNIRETNDDGLPF